MEFMSESVRFEMRNSNFRSTNEVFAVIFVLFFILVTKTPYSLCVCKDKNVNVYCMITVYICTYIYTKCMLESIFHMMEK